MSCDLRLCALKTKQYSHLKKKVSVAKNYTQNIKTAQNKPKSEIIKNKLTQLSEETKICQRSTPQVLQ